MTETEQKQSSIISPWFEWRINWAKINEITIVLDTCKSRSDFFLQNKTALRVHQNLFRPTINIEIVYWIRFHYTYLSIKVSFEKQINLKMMGKKTLQKLHQDLRLYKVV